MLYASTGFRLKSHRSNPPIFPKPNNFVVLNTHIPHSICPLFLIIPTDYDLNGTKQAGQMTESTADNQNLQRLSRRTPPSPLSGSLPDGHPADMSQGGLNTFVVLYDYLAQHDDEIQLSAGQLAQILDARERDWWKICSLDGSHRVGYFPANYLAQLYANERPLQVAQTIQVSNGDKCDKLLRGQVSISYKNTPYSSGTLPSGV